MGEVVLHAKGLGDVQMTDAFLAVIRHDCAQGESLPVVLAGPDKRLLEIFGILGGLVSYQAVVGLSVVDCPQVCIVVRTVDQVYLKIASYIGSL